MTNPQKFEDEYFHVLFSIESAIYEIYNKNRELVDYSVDKALNGAVRTLSNQQRGRKPPRLKLSDDEQRIYDSFMGIVEIYTGGELMTEDGEELDLEIEPITLDEMIACFKRIQRSIKTMSDQGRQGYLDFIKQFFGG